MQGCSCMRCQILLGSAMSIAPEFLVHSMLWKLLYPLPFNIMTRKFSQGICLVDNVIGSVAGVDQVDATKILEAVTASVSVVVWAVVLGAWGASLYIGVSVAA